MASRGVKDEKFWPAFRKSSWEIRIYKKGS